MRLFCYRNDLAIPGSSIPSFVIQVMRITHLMASITFRRSEVPAFCLFSGWPAPLKGPGAPRRRAWFRSTYRTVTGQREPMCCRPMQSIAMPTCWRSCILHFGQGLMCRIILARVELSFTRQWHKLVYDDSNSGQLARVGWPELRIGRSRKRRQTAVQCVQGVVRQGVMKRIQAVTLTWTTPAGVKNCRPISKED